MQAGGRVWAEQRSGVSTLGKAAGINGLLMLIVLNLGQRGDERSPPELLSQHRPAALGN